MNLEKKLDRISLDKKEAIVFYESQLSNQELRECEKAKGIEDYLEVLFEKYKESLRR